MGSKTPRDFDLDITPKSKQRQAIEHASNVEAVLEFILAGHRSRPEVIEFCTENFGVHPRTADKYLAEAWAVHGKLSEPKRNTERGKTIQQIDWLFKRAMQDIRENGLTSVNVAAFSKAVDTRMKLFGLAAPDVVEHRNVDAWKDLLKECGVKVPGNGDARKVDEDVAH